MSIYGSVYIGSTGIYLRVDEELLRKFTEVARASGMSGSEAIRKAMEMFIAVNKGGLMTPKMRGLVKSKITLKELEEAYLVSR